MRTQPDQRISLGCVVIAWLRYGSVLALVAAFGGGCRQPGPIPTLPDQTAPAADMVAEAEQIIRDGLTDQNPQIRVNAIEVVAVTKKVKLMPKVQRMLRDQLVPVRFAAALAVGDLQYSLAKADAAKLLNDPDENVRVAAAYAAYRLGSTESPRRQEPDCTSKRRLCPRQNRRPKGPEPSLHCPDYEGLRRQGPISGRRLNSKTR